MDHSPTRLCFTQSLQKTPFTHHNQYAQISFLLPDIFIVPIFLFLFHKNSGKLRDLKSAGKQFALAQEQVKDVHALIAE